MAIILSEDGYVSGDTICKNMSPYTIMSDIVLLITSHIYSLYSTQKSQYFHIIIHMHPIIFFSFHNIYVIPHGHALQYNWFNKVSSDILLYDVRTLRHIMLRHLKYNAIMLYFLCRLDPLQDMLIQENSQWKLCDF